MIENKIQQYNARPECEIAMTEWLYVKAFFEFFFFALNFGKNSPNYLGIISSKYLCFMLCKAIRLNILFTQPIRNEPIATWLNRSRAWHWPHAKWLRVRIGSLDYLPLFWLDTGLWQSFKENWIWWKVSNWTNTEWAQHKGKWSCHNA